MKKLNVLLVTILIIGIACKKESVIDYVVLSGKIENPNSDSLYVLDGFGNHLHSIPLQTDNRFNDTLKIATGLYNLNDGKETTPIYLKPGVNLTVFINTKEFDESVEYSGVGATENNYLANKYLIIEGFGNLQYTSSSLPEDRFLAILDSLTAIKMKNFKQVTNFDDEFIFLESQTLHFEKLNFLAKYENTYSYKSGDKDFMVSDSFPPIFENIELDNEQLIAIPYYIFFIDSYLQRMIAKKFKEDKKLDYVITSLDIIDANIINRKLKEQLTYNLGKWSLSNTKNREEAYKKMSSFIEKPSYKNEIEELYQTLKKTAKGQPSPLFNFVDIHGQMVSLASMKGSVVYIDIWATWCAPCIAEIPSLKKISEELSNKNIKFVSICTMDPKEKWAKMVKEKELGGVQLFAPSSKDAFFKAYTLQGIPRFIIIDKDGNIVDSNAIRPSNPKLKVLLESLI